MADTSAPEQSVVRVEELEKTPQGKVRRWLAELDIADAAESEWRKEGKEIYDLYEAEKITGNAFNVLWSNTETIAPAVYNSTPEPDVRRRFRDADPVGKVASTILERALSYQIDDYDFDAEIKDAILDVLLPGRGVARIVYEPHFVKVTPEGVEPATPAGVFEEYPPEPASDAASQDQIAPQGPQSYEKIVGQDARVEHVQWDKFRRGPGKRWKDVPWMSFEHDFTFDMAVEKFGKDMASQLKYEDGDVKAIKDSSQAGKEAKMIFKTSKVYEIWDRDQRRVIFISPTFKKSPVLEVPDPLKLRQFFPLPRPLYAIASARTLVPKPLYRMYKRQAVELDKITARINKIVYAMKVRGLYASHIKEAADLLDADDNAMLAIENPSLIAENGGLDKLIWILPLDVLANALQYLYTARDQTKQTIYEISGISDILRGSTKVSETATAQQLKSQWGSLRIQKLQKEIQRFIRDLMRLKSEVISEHFTPGQLGQMTNVELPFQAMKMQAQAAIQQAVMQQQPPPPGAQAVLAKPSWEDVMQLLKSDSMRQYKVDIETDSTVADTINQDMTGFSQAVQGIGQIIQGSQAAVASGMLPVDAVKEICLAFARRARTGTALEDALEQIQPPAPPPQKQDNSLEAAQLTEQNKQVIAQMQEQTKQQIAELREQSETQRLQLLEQIKSEREYNRTQLDAAVKVIVASIAAQKTIDPGVAHSAQHEFTTDIQ